MGDVTESLASPSGAELLLPTRGQVFALKENISTETENKKKKEINIDVERTI